MSGGELVPISKAAIAVGKAALSEGASVKQQLTELAKDSPAMKDAAEKYARRVAIKQGILLRLYQPLAKWAGASREYFESDFVSDMSEKIADIPEEHLTSPAPSVAVPAMQGLAYSLEEPDLKEMYLNLLANATDDRVSEQAHPSFAEIIKQLSAREARLLAEVFSQTALPVIQLRLKAPEGAGSSIVNNHVIQLTNLDTGEPTEEQSVPVWIDNWVRLGLVEVDYSYALVAEGRYDWIEQRPELVRISSVDERGREAVELKKGLLRRTDFGSRFFATVTPSHDQTSTES